MDIFVFMLISLFLGIRLWSVLGKNKKIRPSRPGEKIIYLNKKQVSIEKVPPKTQQDLFPGFQESDFLAGAEKAFKMILDAYYERNEKVLSSLVEKSLIKKLLQQEKSSLNPPEIQLLSSHVQSKEIKDQRAFVVVRFVSLHKRKEGEEEVEDTWTFEKSVSSTNPNWIVSRMDLEDGSGGPD